MCLSHSIQLRSLGLDMSFRPLETYDEVSGGFPLSPTGFIALQPSLEIVKSGEGMVSNVWLQQLIHRLSRRYPVRSGARFLSAASREGVYISRNVMAIALCLSALFVLHMTLLLFWTPLCFIARCLSIYVKTYWM
ncbi:hypothetical protein BO82DRAFT_61801 [Aspergillus uvarum CBS 121591]|uniref:Uncharacterized protein n=1 Tax=Aspergillus uvarum CBS 121591 TaxID=1448315 RepID=A0A319CUB9_9EURO|nr:hypothetical protein BO82DRAFT_61801 [Aspergillus uvarum CBS 121591]PYH82423.1 hypothetical protein BO82DRAFT_61801 [Aspergillus uvarum CBS 121591]